MQCITNRQRPISNSEVSSLLSKLTVYNCIKNVMSFPEVLINHEKLFNLKTSNIRFHFDSKESQYAVKPNKYFNARSIWSFRLIENIAVHKLWCIDFTVQCGGISNIFHVWFPFTTLCWGWLTLYFDDNNHNGSSSAFYFLFLSHSVECVHFRIKWTNGKKIIKTDHCG